MAMPLSVRLTPLESVNLTRETLPDVAKAVGTLAGEPVGVLMICVSITKGTVNQRATCISSKIRDADGLARFARVEVEVIIAPQIVVAPGFGLILQHTVCRNSPQPRVVEPICRAFCRRRVNQPYYYQ